MLKRMWGWLSAEIEIECRFGMVYFIDIPILPMLDIRIRWIDGHHR